MEVFSNKVGSQLIDYTTKQIATKDSFTKNTCILIHGFTANGSNLLELANVLSKNGKNCIIYNYDSLAGIDTAARSFIDLMNLIFINLKENDNFEFTIVAHSMGGLVARYIYFLSIQLNFKVKLIFTLGTPHQGVIQHTKINSFFYDYFEESSNVKINAKVLRCASIDQLMKLDKGDSASCLVDRINKMKSCPIISISGGMPKLFSSGIYRSMRTRAFNKIFQKAAGNEINDGLILEKSSDIRNIKKGKNFNHHNTYTDYHLINHSNLVNCQYIAGFISVNSS